MRRIMIIALAIAMSLALTGCPLVFYTLNFGAGVQATMPATALLVAWFLQNPLTATAYHTFVSPDTANPTPPPADIASAQYRKTNVTVTVEEIRRRLDAIITAVVIYFYYTNPDTGSRTLFGSPRTITLPTPVTVSRGQTEDIPLTILQEWLSTPGINYTENQSVTPFTPVTDAGAGSSIFADARSNLDDANAVNPFGTATLAGQIILQLLGESSNGEPLESLDIVNAVTYELVKVTSDTNP